MLKSITNFFNSILDILLPKRRNFTLVREMNEETLYSLPKGAPVENEDWIYPLFYYKDPRVKALIWEIKYKENLSLLGDVGKIMYEEIVGIISDVSLFDSNAEFLLIPIPITTERRIERGYNQTEYIAKAVLHNDTRRVMTYAPQWFQKTRETNRQSHSETKQQRIENLVGCFYADDRVYGKYIILIDDVVTTGSTLLEAKNTLTKKGIKDVYAFTIAH